VWYLLLLLLLPQVLTHPLLCSLAPWVWYLLLLLLLPQVLTHPLLCSLAP
jgi:hypothetical protein